MIGSTKTREWLLQSVFYSLILAVVFFYVLNVWSSLIIPFIVAVLFSFAIIALANFFKIFRIPWLLTLVMSLWVYVGLFWLLWKMIGSNIEELTILLPEYQNKVINLVVSGFAAVGISEPQNINQILAKVNLQDIFTTVISWVTSIFSSAGIILFYVMFILLEHRFFKNKLNLMIWEETRKKQVFEIIEKIKWDVKSYFVIKGVVSFITALLSYIVMKIFGLDFAIFWAILVFVLNFIPSIWSIIAVAFPALLSLIQFEGYYIFIGMTSILVSIQVVMWNIIEPKFMWNKLNLSPLVIIIALWFWWSIWWVAGMLLAVPLMVIINIILAKIPATRAIAILLSEKWELQVDGWEEVIKHRRQLFKKMAAKMKIKKKN